MPLTAKEIRETFLSFFEERGHRRVPSASVVPDSDPTLLFVNAGMVPFKRVLLGEEVRPYKRATSSQKCIRVSGKHNDLEEVGRSSHHHTFFEMLGNFSFGDYFKTEAIEFAWELLTQKLKLDPNRLAVSVFREDDESYELWRDRIGLPESRIYRLDEKENFWSMGETGPCGPCSELHFDFGKDAGCGRDCDPSCDCGRWTEIWNLVFMQFNRDADGVMTPLPKPGVDTGAGLERLARVIQGAASTYDSDVFTLILARAEEVSGVTRGGDPEKDVSLCVVADHARSVTVLIGDGVLPSNEGRGYVLRRILRRASRHGVLLGLEEPFLYRVADAVIDELAGAYPELAERRAFILDRIRVDEERFLQTLSKGLVLLEEEIKKLRAARETVLSGEIVFKLYDTYGFPIDLTADILRGQELRIDQAGFDRLMQAQRERARAAWKGSGDTAVGEIYGRIDAVVTPEFCGYEGLEAESTVAALVVGGEPVESARKGTEVEVVVPLTPFYAESGGQVGDRGRIESGRSGAVVEVRDTQKPTGSLIVHHGTVTAGELRLDDPVTLSVDAEARAATVRNHSGTHLLHAALREVLGSQAMQKGSLVGPDRLRFDFTHDEPLGAEEIERIEDLVNGWIEANVPAEVRIMPYPQAIKAGAVAIFEEKYGDEVRVQSFGDFSTELCGGTHAGATGEIGLLRILSESGIASGVRRIEALTGLGAIRRMREQERTFQRAAELLKAPPAEVPARIEKLLQERSVARREIEELRAGRRGASAADLVSQAREINGVKVLAGRVDGADAKTMRTLVDDLRQKLGSGIVLLAAETDGKALVAVGVTQDLTGSYKAGDLVKEVAKLVGGGGGGRPDFAQAGGKDPSQIDAALEHFYGLLES
ncbi:MAG: alanine--tRNA ligase [Proteobacteria bacterium]|nr:alanine--tRNA ligase [Pseudomonadota bacterium]